MTIVRIMTTDNGPHLPEDWAVVTAESMFPLSDDIAANRKVEALRLQAAIAGVLATAHRNVQEEHRSNLRGGIDKVPDHVDEANNAMAGIQRVAAGTPWDGYWADEERYKRAHAVIVNHMQTVSHIEHHWHHGDTDAHREWRRQTGA